MLSAEIWSLRSAAGARGWLPKRQNSPGGETEIYRVFTPALLALLSWSAHADVLKLICTEPLKVTTVDLTIDTQFQVASGHVRTRFADHQFLEKPAITPDTVSFDLKLPYNTLSNQRAHFVLNGHGLLLQQTFPDVPRPPTAPGTGLNGPYQRDPTEQIYRCVRLPPAK